MTLDEHLAEIIALNAYEDPKAMRRDANRFAIKQHAEAARAIIAKGETWWRCADCKDFSGTPGLCYRNLQRTPVLVIPLDEEAPDD